MTKRRIVRVFVFGVVLIGTLMAISNLFINHLYKLERNIHKYFYELEPDSLDLLFVGSSHSYCGFSPEVLYEEYGISSYNIGTSNQSMLANYLWAKEAYRTQKYDVLVVEMMSIGFNGSVERDIRSMFAMYPSTYFFELIPEYKSEAYKVLFPVFSLHNDWVRFGETEYQYNNTKEALITRGYTPVNSQAGEAYSESILLESTVEEKDMYLPYLDEIRCFCEENDIALILVKSVMASNDVNVWDDSKHHAVNAYAEKYDIPFIDFNSREYIKAASLILSEDVAADLRHASVSGASKMTKYIGQYILEDLDVLPEM